MVVVRKQYDENELRNLDRLNGHSSDDEPSSRPIQWRHRPRDKQQDDRERIKTKANAFIPKHLISEQCRNQIDKDSNANVDELAIE